MDAGINPRQLKNCRKKIKYETREAALYFAEADGLRAYQCPACRAFHLTSQKVAKARREYSRLR